MHFTDDGHQVGARINTSHANLVSETAGLPLREDLPPAQTLVAPSDRPYQLVLAESEGFLGFEPTHQAAGSIVQGERFRDCFLHCVQIGLEDVKAPAPEPLCVPVSDIQASSEVANRALLQITEVTNGENVEVPRMLRPNPHAHIIEEMLLLLV
jgi:hypothetical protein